MSARIELVAVGNELLLGDVLDTNSHWLCGQLAGLGGEVRRVCIVGDDVEAIAAEVGGALSRGTDLLVLNGGLGPTADDLTLLGIAQALGRTLRVHPQALPWVASTYARLASQGHVDSPDMTPARVKMARLPEGAEPLRNDEGAAPGVWLDTGRATIVSLPGVPCELKAIFHSGVRPRLGKLLGARAFAQWRAIVGCGDESVLAPLLEEVASRHPQVYMKSRARRFGASEHFVISLSARADSELLAETLLRAASDALAQRLEAQGIQILSVERIA